MLKSTALGLAFTILLWQPAMAQSAVTVGYDFYTLHRALEAKSSGIEYDQDSSGFMFAAESEIDQDSSITFEYRDIGEGSFRCTTDFDVVEIDGENWFCDAGDEVETEASSFAVSYKTYNEKMDIGNSGWVATELSIRTHECLKKMTQGYISVGEFN
jgi:hypothetical protein